MLRKLFLCILIYLVDSSEFDVFSAKDLLQKMTFSGDNFVSSYYQMRMIYLNSTQNAQELPREIFHSVIGKYYDAISEYYVNSIEECLRMVLNTNDIDYYVFFGTLIYHEKFIFMYIYAIENFRLAKTRPRKYGNFWDDFFKSYRGIINFGILSQSLDKISWQEQKRLLSIVIEIMRKFAIKCGDFHQRERGN